MTNYDSVQRMLASQQRTLVSIYPVDCKERCRLATINPSGKLSGFTDYMLPAAPKGKFSTLVVTGASDIGKDWMTDPPQPIARPVIADDIAAELVRMFVGSAYRANTTTGPGIWVAPQPVPTEQEILDSQEYKDARTRQEAYFRYLIQDGDVLHDKGQPVTKTHRVAAAWMGTEDRPWAKEVTEKRNKTCPACSEYILATAVKCRHCQTDLIEFATTYGIDKAADPFVWQRVQARTAKPPKAA
jgi:hypothetical protein